MKRLQKPQRSYQVQNMTQMNDKAFLFAAVLVHLKDSLEVGNGYFMFTVGWAVSKCVGGSVLCKSG